MTFLTILKPKNVDKATILELEQLYCISVPWIKSPEYEPGNRVYCNQLGLEKMIVGVCFGGNETWVYFVQHNGNLTKVPQWAIAPTKSYSKPLPNRKFELGDLVKCNFHKIQKTCILGICWNKDYWMYTITNPNLMCDIGLPCIAVVPESYLCNI